MNEDTAEKFLQHPENFTLFRGEGPANAGGTHFSLDENWTKHFGATLLTGRLPAGSRIKLLTEADMQDAFERGIFSEQALWDSLFEQGYDAILGHDAMMQSMLDVIVNPKHHARFEIRESLE